MTKWYVFFLLLGLTAGYTLQAQTLKSEKRLVKWTKPGAEGGQRNFFYELTVENGTWEAVQAPFESLNQGEVWDDPEYLVGLPADFDFLGEALDTLVTTSLGGAFGGAFANPALPLIAYISPFDADLLDRGQLAGNDVSLSPIRSKVVEMNGQDVLIVEWNNAGFYDEWDQSGTMDMFINFQAWFHAGTDVIEYRFGPSNITDPDLIYFGEPGTYIGFASFDLEAGDVSDIHLLQGPAASPSLSSEEITISGTPPNGIIYRFTPADPSSVQENASLGLALWPNPATDMLLLHTEGQMVEQATILSIAGQPLWTAQQLTADPVIPVAHLTPGTYFLQVRTARGSETFPWVKQ